jgi:hypothetical protein
MCLFTLYILSDSNLKSDPLKIKIKAMYKSDYNHDLEGNNI